MLLLISVCGFKNPRAHYGYLFSEFLEEYSVGANWINKSPPESFKTVKAEYSLKNIINVCMKNKY